MPCEYANEFCRLCDGEALNPPLTEEFMQNFCYDTTKNLRAYRACPVYKLQKKVAELQKEIERLKKIEQLEATIAREEL